MSSEHETWEKRGIELPPGWHAALLKLSELTGVSLKYLYTVAIDRLLTDADVEGVEEAAWNIQRRAKKDLQRVGARHTPGDVEKKHQQAGRRGKKR